MANAFQIAAVSAKDVIAGSFCARFTNSPPGSQSTVQSGQARFATSITMCAGEQFSHGFAALVNRGIGIVDEQARKVAFSAAGPAGKIKLLSRAAIDYVNGTQSTPIMTGTLVQFTHDFGEDTAVAVVMDDRFILSKYTVYGRVCYDPDAQMSYFDAGSDTVFNFNGQPDCLDSPTGPQFAPCGRYGWQTLAGPSVAETQTEPVPGAALTKSRSWRVSDIITYLSNFCNAALFPQTQVDYGSFDLTGFINWDSAISTAFAQSAVRTVNNLNLQNKTLLRALTLAIRKAGAYDLYIQPSGSFGSRIMIVSMNPSSGYGISLYLPSNADDLGQQLNNPLCIRSGHVTESAVNFFDNTAIVGNGPAVEGWRSTSNAGAGVSAGTGDNQLEFAWDTVTDFANFKNFVTNYSIPNSKDGFLVAMQMFPFIFCTYRMAKNCDFLHGTSWQGLTNGGPHARIRPTLLSGTNTSDKNPRNWEPVALSACEVYQQPVAPAVVGTWQPVALNQVSVKLSPDAEFVFIDLRNTDAGSQSWENPTGAALMPANLYLGTGIVPRDIRFTLACEADFAICGRATGDPQGTGNRVQKQPWTFTSVAADGDYVDWQRLNSKPFGLVNGAAPTTQYPDANTAGGPLFSDYQPGPQNPGAALPAIGMRIQRHASLRQADVKRVELSGVVVLACINAALTPGMAVTIEGLDVIKNKSVIKSVTHDAGQNETRVELTSADMATLYDLPIPSPGSYTPSVGAQAVKKGDDYEKSTGAKYTDTGSSDKRSDYEKSTGYKESGDSETKSATASQQGPRAADKSAEMMAKLREGGESAGPAGPTGDDRPVQGPKDPSRLSDQSGKDFSKPSGRKGKDFSQLSEQKQADPDAFKPSESPAPEQAEKPELRENERPASSASRMNPEAQSETADLGRHKGSEEKPREARRANKPEASQDVDVHAPRAGGAQDKGLDE